jgi:hypothetical protein
LNFINDFLFNIAQEQWLTIPEDSHCSGFGSKNRKRSTETETSKNSAEKGTDFSRQKNRS